MNKSKMTRRKMLSTLGKVSLAAIPSIGLWSCKPAKENLDASLDKKFKVAILPCPEYHPESLMNAVRAGWEKTDPPEVKNKKIVIKPNLVEISPARPINTDKRLVEALIQFLQQQGAGEVVIAEGAGHYRDTESLWKKSGYYELKDKYKVSLIDLNYDDLQKIKTVSFQDSLLKDLFLPRTILSADVIISVPKMKTHHWVGVTLSQKNLLGIVPGIKYGWPKNIIHWNGIEKSIVEINATIPSQYTVVDGITGMEGDGPIMGSSKQVGVLVMGDNALSVDATSARIMGLDPAKIIYFQAASKMKLGTLNTKDIILTGSDINDFRTEFKLDPAFNNLKV